MKIALSVSSILALAQLGLAANGPAFSTGPVGSGSWIREATATLVVPNAPNPAVGNTVLWVGMGTDKGDLIQGINNNYPKDTLGDACSNLAGNWCVAAYTLAKTGDNSQTSISGPKANSKPGQQVTMHYKYNDFTQQYDQDLAVDGKVVSTISSSKGHHAMGWGTALECTTKPCGTVPAHAWTNVKITLNTPDPNYIQTNWKGPGVTGNMVTNDGGKTWTVDRISIPQYTFTTD
ncbi:hypothetical protein V5O48_006447 [Marasmius crinis-equi]|uniref:Uncharacterized protein n=1 Tax=Marasmius crinis-equi TaxID=585013 RepID=A0ABR3FJG7_9AGAR